ncbi:retropepsin-like aspartic protease family protein [Microbulbifer litoralis]|uniref:retropepsin-like aspartic protease family protein n=1 Tax=Microbulbifer litoralis TaxID=2933965 RepID=UPI002027E3FF|nr:TIGR02281 family clan AA aspartic protease [Microbulbifer sp. GX H0434]
MYKMILALLCLLPLAAAAQQVQLKGLFGSSAMLEIGGEQRLLKSGQTSPEGVTLLEATTDYARIEANGREQKLTLDAPVASNYVRSERAEVRLVADAQGHFSTRVWVNGRRVPVLVDTGATSVAFNYPTARNLGLDFDRAQPVNVSTASGVARGYKLNLDSVTIGGIKVHNVEATILPDDFPEITLLGNSFLSRVDMEQQRGMLILRARN